MIQRIKQRAEAGAMVMMLVVPLAFCVFGFLGLAGYFAFREMLPPDLAALVTAACGIVLIALILALAKIAAMLRGSSTPKNSGHDFELGEELEAALRDHADPVLRDWVRSNPDKAALTTLALGVAAGYSGQFRRVLTDLYARYSETEADRRNRR
jgi:hypothetical protein